MSGNGKIYFHFLAHLILFCCFPDNGKAATPVFTAYTPGTITEGLPPGSPYYTFIATDATPGDVVKTYSLESKALEWFNINNTSGVTTVKKTIDREVMKSLYRYKVYASDGTNTAEEDVNQRILDINDNPPVFSNLPRNINLDEDFPVGSLVFTVTATDADLPPADFMEFAIEAGNEEGIFEFPNPAEGKINVKKPLDYDDGKRQFLLLIIAKNTQDPKLNSTAVLTINVQNVDDLGAKFEKNLYEAKVIEDSLPGTVVTTVQAEDRDRLNATVEYNIYQETNPGNTYKVNNNTGEITVNGPLTIGTHMLVITATSTKHPPTFTVVRITVVSSNSTVSTQTISTMRPSTITGVKTTVAIMPDNINEVSASVFIIGFVILGIILALNTFLLGYIIWKGQMKRDDRRIKNDSKRNEISSDSTNIALDERGDIELGDSSQNVSPVAAEPRDLLGPASVAHRSPMRTDYEDVNTNQTPMPLHTYQALIVSPSSDQSSHAYESLHKYGENNSSSTTI